MNLRNFLITQPDRNLKMIHLPNFWQADPAIPYSEAMVHLDQSVLLSALLDKIGYPKWRLYFYAAYSAYVILVYVERFGNTTLNEALPWGGKRPLMQILDEYLRNLKYEIA
jgi:hypothetical protein